VRTLEEVIRDLPPELREDVRHYAQSLLHKRAIPRPQKLRLSWAGGLRDVRDQFTALDLQRKALEWWGD
jgi:hypothetical protein